MTSRQAGRRLSTIAAEKKRRAGFQQAGCRRAAAARKEHQPLGRLVICSLAFVLLVAGKLLLPEKIAELDQHLSAALERNIDVQAVFSAVGRAISGQEDLMETAGTVYRAVFRPEEAEAVETAVREELEMVDTAAIDTLRSYRPEPVVQKDTEREDPEASSQMSTLAYVLYSDENLPKSVSLEQAILGFDYCTPVAGVVSSGFGYREHPVEGEERFHYGIDLAADTGTEVRCFADGTVTAVGESSSYGKYCIVEHEGGFSTLYAHCSRITVSSGAAVSGGGKIAEVGETGIATGPHLHFELQKDGKYLNPIYYLSPL